MDVSCTELLTTQLIIIDLDPSDDKFDMAITAALAAKEVFDKYKLKVFVKTSGKTGIHLFIPSEGFTFPQARRIAEAVCHEVHQLTPSITTVAVEIDRGGNKLYLDPNQNDEADTVASAYSVRPYHLPTVSTPLEWKEVNIRLNPHDFTIETMLKRIEKKGDLFKDILSPTTVLKNSKNFKKAIISPVRTPFQRVHLFGDL